MKTVRARFLICVMAAVMIIAAVLTYSSGWSGNDVAAESFPIARPGQKVTARYQKRQVRIDGTVINNVEAYLIDDFLYFKLRDLAVIFNSAKKKVTWHSCACLYLPALMNVGGHSV